MLDDARLVCICALIGMVLGGYLFHLPYLFVFSVLVWLPVACVLHLEKQRVFDDLFRDLSER